MEALSFEGARRTERLYRVVSRLFESRRDDRSVRNLTDDIDWMLGSLARREITISWTHISHGTCDRAARDCHYHNAAGESAPHSFMKRAALFWMQASGARDAREEYRWDRWKFDVFSPRRDWTIEVGNTPIKKLRDCIVCGGSPRSKWEPSRFSLIPFQFAGDMYRPDDGRRPILVFEFHWSEAFARGLFQGEMRRQGEMLQSANRNLRDQLIAEAQARKAAREAASPVSPVSGRS